LRVITGAFLKLELVCGISSHPEVGVLVDSSRDQTRNVSPFAEDVRERAGEGGDYLHGWERILADGVVLLEAKGALDLVIGD